MPVAKAPRRVWAKDSEQNEIVAVDQFGLLDESEDALDLTRRPACNLSCVRARVIRETARYLSPFARNTADDVTTLKVARDLEHADRQQALAT